MARQILGKVVPTGEDTYDNNRTYDELCIVMYNGQSYISKKETRGNKPDNTEYWQQLVEKPVKGADYFTEADKDEIVNDVTNDATNKYNQAVATGIETFNQNAERKTSDFNDNASEKTDTYNANADSTTQAFTNNANSKTEAYNTNATEKLGTYNSNHTAKLKEYNDNASSKLSAYNTNTVTKTTEYNSNHTSKINAYDTNASNKVDVYNTNADTRLEEYNTNADNKIAEYDEHSKELNNKIVSIGNDYRMVKDQLLYTGEDTDTFIHLEDSAMAEMKEVKVDGVISQETTNGYQLFDVSKVTTISNGTIENEIVTSNVLSGNGQGFTYNFPSIALTANTTYYIFADIRIKSGTGSVNGINNGVVGWEKVSFHSLSNNYNTFISKYTPTENENMYSVYFGFSNANNLIVNVKNVMITTNRNATYEPFTNGASPNPDYPQEIKTITGSLKVTSCGKNLINSSAPSINTLGISFTNNGNGTYTISGTIPANKNINLDVTTSKPILQKGKTYTQVVETISGTKIGSIVPSFIKQNGSVIYNYFTDNQTRIPAEQLVNNAYNYYYSGAETEINWTFRVMLCEGSNATYEDYIETQIQANLPENEFIGKLNEIYKDTLRAKYNKDDGQYHLMLDKKIGKYVLNGSERWTIDDYASTNYYRYSTKIPNLTSSVSKGVQAMNSHFKQRIYENHGDYEYLYVQSSENSGVIYIQSQKWVSVNELKTWLASNNVEVYYALETPYTLDLGPIDMPMSYKDITNIFTDSDLLPTINAKYYRVFDKTIQNAQINEKTLKQEITDLNATVSALDTRLKVLETKTVEEPTESEGTL